MRRYRLVLTAKEREQLKRWLKNPPKPYLRERARAILLVAEGKEGQAVSQLLRIRVHRTTVGEWVRRYQAEGIEGLKIKAGRGRKPRFFPSPERTGQGGRGGVVTPLSL